MQETDLMGKITTTILSNDPKRRRKQILAALDRFDSGSITEIRIYQGLTENTMSEETR